MHYNYWLIEKGYARKTGPPRPGDPAWARRARGWIRVMYLDALASMVVYTVVTAAFYVLGAAILHHRGEIPKGFEMVKTLSRDSLIRLCHLDYTREMALVAERKNEQGRGEIVGVSRYYMNPQTRSAEFAVIVRDAYQGQGLGQHLMERLIVAARERHVKQLVGQVLRENQRMLMLAKDLGFREVRSAEHGVVEVALDL